MKRIITVLVYLSLLHHPSSIFAQYSSETKSFSFRISTSHLKLHIESHQIHANHGLSIQSPYGLISGKSGTIDLRSNTLTIQTPHIILDSPSLEIGAHYMSLLSSPLRLDIYHPNLFFRDLDVGLKGNYGRCDNKHCEFYDTATSICSRSYLTVVTRKIVTNEHHIVDLHDVQVKYGRRSLFKVHFLRLMPKNRAGFTAPILGFSPISGFIVGPSGTVPLSRDSVLAGHLSLHSRLGLETQASVHTKDVHLTLHHLQPPSTALFWLRGSISKIDTLSFFSDIDWVSDDRRIIEVTKLYPEEQSVAQVESRIRLEAPLSFLIIESQLSDVIPFSHDGKTISENVISSGFQISLPSVTISDSLFFGFSSEIHNSNLPNQLRSTIIPNTYISLTPSMTFSPRMGILHVKLSASSLHLFAFDSTHSPFAFHRLLTESAFTAPFYRDFSSFRHTVTPRLSYQFSPFSETPNLGDNQGSSHSLLSRISAGLYTSVSSYASHLRLVLTVTQVFDQGESVSNIVPSYSTAGLRIKARSNTIALDAALDSDSKQFSLLGISTKHHLPNASYESGIRYIDTGDGPHSDAYHLYQSPFSLLFVEKNHTIESRHVEYNLSQNLSLSKIFSFRSGIRVSIAPKAAMNVIWYGLEFRPLCNWLVASILSIHQPENTVPSLTFQLRLFPYSKAPPIQHR